MVTERMWYYGLNSSNKTFSVAFVLVEAVCKALGEVLNRCVRQTTISTGKLLVLQLMKVCAEGALGCVTDESGQLPLS